MRTIDVAFPVPASAKALIVVEWSFLQGCIHIHTLGDLVSTNFDMLLSEPTPSDFLPIGVFSTMCEAQEYARKVEPAFTHVRNGGRIEQLPVPQDVT